MESVDWNQFAPLMLADDIAALYRLKPSYVKKCFQRRSDRVPTPCQKKPWAAKKDVVKRHFDRLSLTGRV